MSGRYPRRITLFAGHYGSGKTNIALNYARYLKRDPSAIPDSAFAVPGAPRVSIADLDIVNPYFRTKDSRAALAADGIELVVSEFANSNVDFPALPKEIYALTDVRGDASSASGPSSAVPHCVVIDVGGDDRGALALGRYVDDIRASGDYEMLGVVNFSRPLTRTPEDAVGVLREIEWACRLPFTGLVNNTNLGQETAASVVLDSVPLARRTAEIMDIPLRFTCAPRPLAPALVGKVDKLLPIDIQKLYYQLEK